MSRCRLSYYCHLDIVTAIVALVVVVVVVACCSGIVVMNRSIILSFNLYKYTNNK
uniref:Bm13190 n=1 Tax=Brugia malayi TaxID=6279 RepID=A0A1I9GBV7_BRUMA|nr:Bm13190 [Brugia malayi]